MSSQGSAKAPDLSGVEHDKKKDSTSPGIRTAPSSTWYVWKQVIIGEILNILERRRYDSTEPR